MEPVDYNRVLSQTRPSSVVLRSLLVTTTRRNFSSRAASVPHVEQESSWTRRDDHVIFSHSYDAKLNDEASEDALMVIRAIYEMALYTEAELPEEFLEEYKSRQLPITTRPYFRELIANCSHRSLIQAPPLPTQYVPPVVGTRDPSAGDSPRQKTMKTVRARRKDAQPLPPQA